MCFPRLPKLRCEKLSIRFGILSDICFFQTVPALQRRPLSKDGLKVVQRTQQPLLFSTADVSTFIQWKYLCMKTLKSHDS